MNTSSSGSRACTRSATMATSSMGDSTVLRRSFGPIGMRSEEHTSELQSLMRISYDVVCLKKKKKLKQNRKTKRNKQIKDNRETDETISITRRENARIKIKQHTV